MFTNLASKEINLKLVYYGPGLGGKTTNIQRLHDAAPPELKTEMVSLATEADRTLFFDFLPMELGTVNGFKVRLHLYTVPGQVFYEATRKLVVRGADGIVLVADSQYERMEANIEALEGLQRNLAEHNLDLKELPYVVQCNKRDLEGIASMEEMREALNFKGEQFIEAAAVDGKGVDETLKALSRAVMRDLRDRNRLANLFATAGNSFGGAETARKSV